MPVYEYQGQHYDIETDDPSVAKSKIFKHLGIEEPTAAGSFGKAATESIAPAIGGFAGAEAGLAAGAGLGAMTGPAAPIAVPAFGLTGALAGGLGGGYLAQKGQEYLGGLIPQDIKSRFGFGEAQRKAEKEKYPGYSLAGELIPGLMSGTKAGADVLQKGTKPARELISKAYGKEPKQLAEALRTNLTGRVKDVISGVESAQAQPISQLQRVGRAQEQLGSRGPVAAGRQTMREQRVDQALNQLSPQGTVLAEDLGGAIQNAGRKNIEQLRSARQTGAIQDIKHPAFADAKSREAAGDFIATNPKSAEALRNVLARLEKDIADTPEPYASELRRRFASIRGTEKPLTEGERRAAELRASVMGTKPETAKVEPMTLNQAEFLRRMLKDKSVAEVEGFKALDVKRMNDLAEELTRAMNAYEPRIGEYLSKYRELSAPIERAVAGRGKPLTEAEQLAEEQVLFAADKSAATNYYLNGSAERAQRLIDLVGGKKPEVVGAVRGYMRSQLQGMNAKQAADFLQKNEGLLRVFPELKSPMQTIVQTKGAAETMGTAATQRAGEAATRLAGQEKQATQRIGELEKVAEKFRPELNKLELSTPAESVDIAKSVIDKLRSSRQIDDAAHRQLYQQLEQVVAKFGEKQAAKDEARRLAIIAMQMAGLGTIAYYGGKSIVQGVE